MEPNIDDTCRGALTRNQRPPKTWNIQSNYLSNYRPTAAWCCAASNGAESIPVVYGWVMVPRAAQWCVAG